MSQFVRRWTGRGLRSLRLSALSALIATSSAGAFEETFDRDGVIEEASRAAVSRSPRWWVSAGGRVTFEDGTARTIQGSLPAWDPWARAYARSKPVDTEGGRRPQNVFRMVTRETGRNFRQRVSVRIHSTNLAASTERGPFSGIFLESRFLNDNNFYVAGLRFDGQAVVKKRREAEAFTIGVAPVYPGTYDRQSRPNLLPEDRWFSIRSTIADVPGGVQILLELHDPALGADWIPVLEVLDGPGGPDGEPIRGAGSAGIRTDFMDVELENYLVFEPADLVPDRPGFHDPSTAAVVLQVVPTPEAPPTSFAFGPAAEVRAFAGRFDARSCADRVALYEPGSGFFAIAAGSEPGAAAAEFRFGPSGGGLLPIAGDWDGDGADGIGVFRADDGLFALRNVLGPGSAERIDRLPGSSPLATPLAGRWEEGCR